MTYKELLIKIYNERLDEYPGLDMIAHLLRQERLRVYLNQREGKINNKKT